MTEQVQWPEKYLAELVELEKARAATRDRVTGLVIAFVVIVLAFILCF